MYGNLKAFRESIGMTQKEFATSLSIGLTTYNGYETGARDPKSDFWVSVAQKYGITIDYLMGHSNDPHKTSENDISSKLMPSEQAHIKKYRLLDPYGKEAVDGVLDVESRRCEAEKQARVAAVREEREKMEAAEDIVSTVTLNQPYSQVAAAEGSGAYLEDGEENDKVTVELNKYTQQADAILKVVGRSMQPVIADGDRILVRIQPSVNIGEIGVFIIDGQGYLKEYAEDRLISLNPDIDDVFIGDFQQAECYGKFIAVLDPNWVK